MAKNNSDRKYYQIILDWFQEQLATGALKKGDRLPSERELAQRLQVSRVPVREAMLILEHTGIIASSPKGSFVVCSSGRDTHRRELMNYTNVEAVDILHQVANFYVGTKQSHDYGTGEVYTSVEVQERHLSQAEKAGECRAFPPGDLPGKRKGPSPLHYGKGSGAGPEPPGIRRYPL